MTDWTGEDEVSVSMGRALHDARSGFVTANGGGHGLVGVLVTRRDCEIEGLGKQRGRVEERGEKTTY